MAEQVSTLEEVLWAAFEADPFGSVDGVPIALTLADRLEEQGEGALAAAVRWMLAERKRPHGKNSQWYDGPCRLGLDPESDLPPAIYRALTRGEELVDDWNHCYRAYATRRAAVADLAKALRTTRSTT